MSTQQTQDRIEGEGTSHRTLYIVIAIVIVALMVVGVVRREKRERTEETARLAQQYISAVQTAGFFPPDPEFVENLFGTDGGALCESVGTGTGKAFLNQMLASGAAGPGQRVVLGDNELEELVQRGQLAVGVYCPDKSGDYAEFMDSLDIAPVGTGAGPSVPSAPNVVEP